MQNLGGVPFAVKAELEKAAKYFLQIQISRVGKEITAWMWSAASFFQLETFDKIEIFMVSIH